MISILILVLLKIKRATTCKSFIALRTSIAVVPSSTVIKAQRQLWSIHLSNVSIRETRDSYSFPERIVRNILWFFWIQWFDFEL